MSQLYSFGWDEGEGRREGDKVRDKSEFLSSLCSLRVDNLQQSKARLEVSNQTLKAQHQKELESREEELEQIKTTMNKKLKSLGDQIEELHEEKQQALKVSSRTSPRHSDLQ